MRQHAVLITLLFAFFVTLFSVSAVFFEFYKLNKKQYYNHIFTKHSIITQIYRAHQIKHSPQMMIEANLAVYQLDILKDKKEQKRVLKDGTILKREGFKSIDEALMLSKKGVYTQRVVSNLRATMLEYHNTIYFYMQAKNNSVLIRDNSLKPYKYISVLYTYATVMLIISISFFMILQKLKPLIVLRRKIAKFGNGDMNISFKTRATDEIGLISNELENARAKITKLIESRTLFLRNIMHELKTPIAKGTIATQMLPTQKQRDRFSSIFGRLESLVNEFALIEEVTSLDDRSGYKEYRLVDIIDGAIDMAMVERESVSVDIDAKIKIFASYRLYTTAIKNMIDNGIKYSTDSHVKILMIDDELCFESKGECIKYPLHYYIEPFTKENPSKNSFGLGLYLVDSILKVHDKVLAHEYHNGVNRFIFA